MTDSTVSTGELPDSLTRLYDDPEAEAAALRERAGNADLADRVSRLCSALSNPLRLRLLWALRDGECCVCELQTAVEAPQSTVASQLRCLTDSGLVTTRKEGKWTYYRVADSGVFELVDRAAELADSTADAPNESTEVDG